MEKKIFGIGFNKTGTTSLHKLFIELQLRSYHGVEWRKCDDVNFYTSYDCFSDGTPENLTFLDLNFPHSQFIFLVRELDSWIASRLEHIAREKERGSWKFNLQKSWDDTDSSIIDWVIQRNTYHYYILKYFQNRPKDLLVLNYIRDKDASYKVAQFIGKEMPVVKPHEYANPKGESISQNEERITRVLLQHGVKLSEFKYDLFVPSLLPENIRTEFSPDTDF